MPRSCAAMNSGGASLTAQGADLGPSCRFAYVTPDWYATKRETGKVVPTWNYVAVHAHGPVESRVHRRAVARR
jgi:hypothetical protein